MTSVSQHPEYAMAESRGNMGNIAQHNGASKMNRTSLIDGWLSMAIIGSATLNRPNIAIIATCVRIDLTSDGSPGFEEFKENLRK